MIDFSPECREERQTKRAYVEVRFLCLLVVGEFESDSVTLVTLYVERPLSNVSLLVTGICIKSNRGDDKYYY